jgi:hypothetical protein
MEDPNEVTEVPLPEGAGPPVRVFVNGAEWTEGEDYDLEGGRLRFRRPLRAQPRLGLRRKLMLGMGIGVYGDLRGDSLDVQYRDASGATRMSAVPLSPWARGAPPA